MSGGSFNYLYSADEVGLLLDKRGDLQEMAEALSQYPTGNAAARETEDILAYLATVERRVGMRVERLREVWRAVEWEHSCDTTREQTLKALAAYNGEP